MYSRAVRTCIFSLAILGMASVSNAASISFTGTSGSLAAKVTFDITGSNLTVVLENTAAYNPATDQLVPAQALAGVLFNLPDTALLTPTDAIAEAIIQGPCSVVASCDGSASPGINIGGEAAYTTSPGIIGTWDRGVGVNGQFGGDADIFGANVDDPGSPNGLNLSIVPNGFTAGDGNGGVDGRPLVQNQITFIFTITGVIPTIDQIDSVAFIYGTSWGEAEITTEDVVTGDVPTNETPTNETPTGRTTGDVPVPEPGSLLLLGSGLVAAATRLRRRKQ